MLKIGWLCRLKMPVSVLIYRIRRFRKRLFSLKIFGVLEEKARCTHGLY